MFFFNPTTLLLLLLVIPNIAVSTPETAYIQIVGNSSEDDPSNATHPKDYPLDYSKVIVSYIGDPGTSIHVYGASSDCYHCLKREMHQGLAIPSRKHGVLSPVDCRYPFNFEFFSHENRSGSEKGRSLANYTLPCGDHGVYHVVVDASVAEFKKCQVKSYVVREPRRWWVPIAVLGGVAGAAVIAGIVGSVLHSASVKRRKERERELKKSLGRAGRGSASGMEEIISLEGETDPLLGEPPAPEDDESAAGSMSGSVGGSAGGGTGGASGSKASAAAKRGGIPGRVASLDVFRGFTIATMIFVNAGGGKYQFFAHSTWNGFDGADLVFPWFLWISGVSAALSRKAGTCWVAGGPSAGARTKRALVRFAELFLLGLFLNNGYNLATWRIGGILQRIAASSLIVSLIAAFVPKLFHPRRGARGGSASGSASASIQEICPYTPSRAFIALADIAPFLLEYVAVLALVAVHTGIIFGLSVPGCGRGYLGPGGDHEYGRYANCTGGAAGYIDRLVFGPNHMLKQSWTTFQGVYNTSTSAAFDPEGILGTLTCVFMLYLGFQAGRTLLVFKGHFARLGRWMAWGVVLFALGIGLCGGTKNGGPIPMNKNLFSISYALVLGGGAFICLAVVYFIVDLLGVWDGTPFRAVGMNSIALYVLSEVFYGYFPFNFSCPQTHPWQLTRATVTTVSWVVVAYVLYFKKIFIKLG